MGIFSHFSHTKLWDPPPRARAHTHFTLINLHWLLVKSRITYKIHLLTYKSLNALAPQYLSGLLQQYTQSLMLRSSATGPLSVPHINLGTFEKRGFTLAALILWNFLQSELHNAPSLESFKNLSNLTYLTKPSTCSLLFIFILLLIWILGFLERDYTKLILLLLLLSFIFENDEKFKSNIFHYFLEERIGLELCSQCWFLKIYIYLIFLFYFIFFVGHQKILSFEYQDYFFI